MSRDDARVADWESAPLAVREILALSVVSEILDTNMRQIAMDIT
jgi:hypothetical protein